MGIMVLLRRAAAAAATANATVSTARAAVHLDRVMLAAVALGQQPQQALRAAANAAAASPGAAWLARLEDHERAGVPRGAGVAGAPGAFDLSRMRALLDALGRPQDRLRAVHVVGTKGKGSVTMLLSAVLHAAGYCVGTYTSPHLLSVRERIALGGGNGSSSSSSCSSSSSSDSSSSSGSSSSGGAAAEPPPSSEAATIISPSDWEVGAARVAAAAEQAGVQPSSFEAVTALALSHFAQAGAQLVVLEAGLGGATDATNVLDGPGVLQAVVLTAVGLDHLEALGDSLASITRAKAGVMQPGVPAVVAKQSPGADGDVVWGEAQAAAAALQPSAPLLRVGDVVSVRHRKERGALVLHMTCAGTFAGALSLLSVYLPVCLLLLLYVSPFPSHYLLRDPTAFSPSPWSYLPLSSRSPPLPLPPSSYLSAPPPLHTQPLR